jgi:hypothetical protein
MDSASVPPWLDVTPAQFGNAAEAGARLDLQRQQMQQEAQQNALRLQLSKQESDRQFQLQTQQNASNMAMKQQQLDMAAQAAARKYQAQQKYAQLVASGMDPATAMLQVGPELGVSLTGAAQLARQSAPVPPPQSLDDGAITYNGRYYPPPKAATEWDDETVDGQLMQRNKATGELKPVKTAAEGGLSAMEKARLQVLQNRAKMIASDPLSDKDPKKQMELKKIQDEIDQITGASEDGEGSDTNQPDASTPDSAPSAIK